MPQNLPDVALGAAHVQAHNNERHAINAIRGALAPVHRQHKNFRRLGPVSTDVSSVTNTTGHDSTLTKQYIVPVTGLSNNQTRKMTNAEYTAAPFVVSPNTNINPRIWDLSGAGYLVPTGSPSNSIDTGETNWPNVTQARIETMTDAPVIEFAFYAYLGTTVTSLQAYVDGSPVTLTPQTYPGAITFYKITFPTGKIPRLVEIVTEGLLTWISIAPNYKVWKPSVRRGPKLMVLGASYVQPIMYDGTSGARTFNRYGHWSQMDSASDIDQLVLDGVGGTGFVTPASGGLGYPQNTYLDRIQAVITTAPDLLVFADAFTNDFFAGHTTTEVINAATSAINTLVAGLPTLKIAFQTGLRTPTYGDFSSSVDTTKTALKSAFPKVYWIDIRNMLDMSGGYTPGHTNGAGNTDWYIGNDGIHPTKEGGDYLRGHLYPLIQKILWDDGTYAGIDLNTI